MNLWYVMDEDGIIYSLRAKAYIGIGSEAEKLEFLQQRASLDYLVAEPFEIPQRFYIQIGNMDTPDTTLVPVAHVSMLQTLDSPIILFEDALKIIEDRFPAQSQLDIPQQPIVCTTPLMQNQQGVIEPRFSSQIRYEI
ncbi:hypothetical protein F4X33_10665 [Candidatus Poribacteria bacterium]|nr:hypothetical protein [Candidatus Poribacteria bacterium]